MDPSKEISDVVARSIKMLKLHGDSVATTTIDELLTRAVRLLCTHPAYIDHTQHDLGNDFAHLANEIVHDVVECASHDVENKADLQNLALIQGSWAEIGNKYAMIDWSLRTTTICRDTDVDKLKARAPKLYEHLTLMNPPERACKMLEEMGTRFSLIDLNGLPESASVQLSGFLKRQVRSKYLRTLRIRTKNKTEDLNALLVEFVKRPQFEELHFFSRCLLPFKVLEEALDIWKATTHFEVENKKIHGYISAESFKKLETQLEKPLEGCYNCAGWLHPALSRLTTRLTVVKCSSASFQLYLTFANLGNHYV